MKGVQSRITQKLGGTQDTLKSEDGWLSLVEGTGFESVKPEFLSWVFSRKTAILVQSRAVKMSFAGVSDTRWICVTCF